MNSILVVGSVNSDKFVQVERFPLPGETIKAAVGSFEVFPGGKGANQAVASRRFGLETCFMGCFGDDEDGRFLYGYLREQGVDLQYSTVRENTGSGQALIFSYPNGDNSIVLLSGSNQRWENIDVGSMVLKGCYGERVVLLQCEVPFSVNLEVAKALRGHTDKVILDLGGDFVSGTELCPILCDLFIVSPNETELSRLTGKQCDRLEEVVEACRFLQSSLGDVNVLVKRGEKGSVYVSRENGEVLVQECVYVEKVVDTTGAGDCFTAAFACKLLERLDIAECMLFASRAASICIQSTGATTSLPTLEQVQREFA